MTVHSTAHQLKYRILIFTLLGIVLTASIAGISVALPFYSFIKADNDKTLILASKNTAMLIETYLTGLRSVAIQITTRTYARKQLEKYLQGDMGKMELEYLSTPELNDAMQMLPELVAIVRHDINGQPLIHVGTQLRETAWKLPGSRINQPVVNGPVIINGKYYIYITTPILSHKKEQLGMDVLVFKPNELHKIIHNASEQGDNGKKRLGWRDNTGIHLFFNAQDNTHNPPVWLNSPLAKAISRAINGESDIISGSLATDDGKAVFAVLQKAGLT